MSEKFKWAFVSLAILLITVQCTSIGEEVISLASEGEDEMGQSTDEDKGYLTDPTTQTTSIQNPSAQPIPTTETTPLPTIDPSNPEPGQVPGGPGMIDEGAQTEETALDEPREIDLATWQVYTNDTYHFKISHPPYFIVKHLDDTELAQLTPSPLTAVYFQDQEMAQSDVAELAPPEFSIRIFENKTQQSIEEWLVMTGLLKRDAGQFTEPYRGTHESGVTVYSQSFMAPGWFVYVADDTYIFQLTPLGTEAELMLDTFEITS